MWYPIYQPNITFSLIERTQPLPPDFPQSLEVDLILRIFEEILFSRLTPDQGSLESSSTFRDLINLILTHQLLLLIVFEKSVPSQKDLSRVDL